MKRLLLVLSFSLACGGGSALGPIPAVDTGSATNSAGAIGPAELRAHVGVLASDEYGGRGTLEPGEQRAADYLIAEFKKYGLQTLPGQADYRVAAELERTGFEVDSTKAVVTVGTSSKTFKGGADFKPFGFSASGMVEAEVVFAGYGISRPDLGYDDYAGLDVKGKIVFVLRHSPKKDSSDKRFDKGRDSFFTTKADVARTKGAIAMVLVTDPKALSGDKAQGDDLRMSWRLSVPSTGDDLEALRKRMVKMKKRYDKAKKPREKKQLAAFAASVAKRYPKVVRAAGFKDAELVAADDAIAAIHVSGPVGDYLAGALPAPLAQIQSELDSGAKTTAALGFDKPVKIRLTVGKEINGGRTEATNVVGFLPGTDPRLRDQWVVVGAHFDHLGRFDGTGDTVYNGADDNASGTSAMLVVARRLASGTRLRRSVVFVGFSAEEKGLLGSKSLVRTHLGPEQVVFMVNMDMLGRNGEKPVFVGGDGYARGLKAMVEEVNQDLGLDLEFGGKSISGNSDHAPFYQRGIPVMNLFTGLHKDYHQLSDHADKLGYSRMAKIAQVAARITTRIANDNQVPAFVHRPLWLGIAVEVEGKGAQATARITEVDADAPASKVGLRVGDTITAVGKSKSFEPTRISDLFGDIEPGTETTISVSRAGTAMSVRVKRAKRGYLGVFPGGTDEATQKKFGLSEGQGVTLNSVVEKGPAALAGLQKGDILIEIAGKPVGVGTLGKILARIGAGEKVPVLLIRKGQRVRLTMVLGERP